MLSTHIGPIPTTFGLMTDLTNIIIYRNSMTGTVGIDYIILMSMGSAVAVVVTICFLNYRCLLN
mgnify:CR=1 FL=1